VRLMRLAAAIITHFCRVVGQGQPLRLRVGQIFFIWYYILMQKKVLIYQTFEILPSRFENVYMIDGEKSIKEVFFKIKEIVLSHFLNNKQKEVNVLWKKIPIPENSLFWKD